MPHLTKKILLVTLFLSSTAPLSLSAASYQDEYDSDNEWPGSDEISILDMPRLRRNQKHQAPTSDTVKLDPRAEERTKRERKRDLRAARAFDGRSSTRENCNKAVKFWGKNN